MKYCRKNIYDSYGFSEVEWNDMKNTIEKYIVEKLAKSKKMISYKDLVDATGITSLHERGGSLSAILGCISEDSFSKNRFCLSSLVVKKCDNVPGDGYYPMLYSLNGYGKVKDCSVATIKWAEDVQRIFKHYG